MKRALQQFRFQLSAKNNPIFLGFYRFLYRPKSGSLSEFLSDYSASRKGDFFVIQVGANDGITHDPIHKFIKRDKWSGILLEPQPVVYRNYLSKLHARSPEVETMCAAIGPEDGTMTLYRISFTEMRWATGLASFNRAQVEKAFSSGLVEKRCAKFGIEMPQDPESWIAAEKVQVISPQTLFSQHQVRRFDLLQIDTEGYDFEIIRLFDELETKPKVIVFEHTHLTNEDQHACDELLRENQYAFRKFNSNTVAMQQPLEDFAPYFERD